jgi:hypothetical protein
MVDASGSTSGACKPWRQPGANGAKLGGNRAACPDGRDLRDPAGNDDRAIQTPGARILEALRWRNAEVTILIPAAAWQDALAALRAKAADSTGVRPQGAR